MHIKVFQKWRVKRIYRAVFNVAQTFALKVKTIRVPTAYLQSSLSRSLSPLHAFCSLAPRDLLGLPVPETSLLHLALEPGNFLQGSKLGQLFPSLRGHWPCLPDVLCEFLVWLVLFVWEEKWISKVFGKIVQIMTYSPLSSPICKGS